MYYVYILFSKVKARTYTGVTSDVKQRLKKHNSGQVKSTRPYYPYKLVYTESFETLREARQKEKFYKSSAGRRKLKSILHKEGQ